MITDTFSKAFAQETEQIVEDVEEGIVEAMTSVIDTAREYAPEVTGELRASGGVRKIDGGAAGEFTADYAVDVHENPESEGYRFLERAFDEHAAAIPDQVADHAKRGR